MPINQPLDIELADVTDQNILQFKTLNMSFLPVRYSDKFYRELLTITPKEFIKYAIWNGFAIGSVCSRLEPHSEKGFNKIYIMTIGVIPAYRRRGIATKLLNHILENAARDPTVLEVYLHVQISNEEAKHFYLSNNFEQVGMLENYYKRIDPPHCFVFRKVINRTLPTEVVEGEKREAGAGVEGDDKK